MRPKGADASEPLARPKLSSSRASSGGMQWGHADAPFFLPGWGARAVRWAARERAACRPWAPVRPAALLRCRALRPAAAPAPAAERGGLPALAKEQGLQQSDARTCGCRRGRQEAECEGSVTRESASGRAPDSAQTGGKQNKGRVKIKRVAIT